MKLLPTFLIGPLGIPSPLKHNRGFSAENEVVKPFVRRRGPLGPRDQKGCPS